jgi:cell shape-determining protein MreC
MIREENTILKDKLKSVGINGGDAKGFDLSSLPARGPSSGEKATDTELKVCALDFVSIARVVSELPPNWVEREQLKRAMEEKKMLITALNESMNNASRLERENMQLQEVENRLR